jgi:hypothetical protein
MGPRMESMEMYSCRSRHEVDTTKLGYFALSILWRAAIHEWPTPYGDATPLSLGPYREILRKYLMGESPFPKSVALLVTVCTDAYSQQTLYDPYPRKTKKYLPYRIYDFLVCGIHFRINIGNAMPSELRGLCCVSGTDRWIVVEDKEDETVDLFARMATDSKLAGQLQEE